MLTPFHEDGQIDWTALDYLVDWYIYLGAQGLFAVCYSSEMFALSEAERLAVAQRTVRRAGNVPVIAAGTFADSIEQIATYSQKLADTGVAAVVCITNQFCLKDDNDDSWERSAERLLRLLDPNLPLGLYECPFPYRRQMSPRLLRWAAATERFYFHKDTSCSMVKIGAKLDALLHSDVRFFNANAVTLLESLRAGGHGFSGIAANYCPQLYAWMCREHERQPDVAERLQWFMSTTDLLIHHKYPAAAKQFLAQCNLPVGLTCRLAAPAFSDEDMSMLEALRRQMMEWHHVLGLRPFQPELNALREASA